MTNINIRELISIVEIMKSSTDFWQIRKLKRINRLMRKLKDMEEEEDEKNLSKIEDIIFANKE